MVEYLGEDEDVYHFMGKGGEHIPVAKSAISPDDVNSLRFQADPDPAAEDTAETRAAQGWGQAISAAKGMLPTPSFITKEDVNSSVANLDANLKSGQAPWGWNHNEADQKLAENALGTAMGATRKVQMANGLEARVLEAPTLPAAKKLLKESPYGVVRYLVDPEKEKVLLWADDIHHREMVAKMGLKPLNPKVEFPAGFHHGSLESEDELKQILDMYKKPKSENKAMGGYVHGGRVNVAGDSEKNDTVPAMLSPGEIVIPRSHSGNAEMAYKFIDQVMAKRKGK